MRLSRDLHWLEFGAAPGPRVSGQVTTLTLRSAPELQTENDAAGYPTSAVLADRLLSAKPSRIQSTSARYS